MIASHAKDMGMEQSALWTGVTLPQGNPIPLEGMSALYRAGHASGYPRFIYGVYAVLGIVLSGIAIFTALNVLMNFLNEGSVSVSGTALPLCYVLLNSIAGHGFMFFKKWLLVAFSGMLIIKILLELFFFLAFHETGLSAGVFIVAGISLFLFLTKHLLSGRYFEPKAVAPIMTILVVSFLLANFGMLH